MSQVSSIFHRYRLALERSRERYSEMYEGRSTNALEFYNNFFHQLVIDYAARWAIPAHRDRLRRDVEMFFGSAELDFVAVDGTCIKDPFNDFMVFFGGSYGVKGRLTLSGNPPVIHYQRWSMDRDVSMVAYIPVPFAELSDVLPGNMEDQFAVADEDRVNLANVHVKIMQLAEIYLAYHVAAGSALEYPRLILLDNSISSIMSATERGLDHLGLLGYRLGQRQLEKRDALIALSHPYNSELGIPSTKSYRLRDRLMAELSVRKRVHLEEFARMHGLPLNQVEIAARSLTGSPKNPLNPPVAYRESSGFLEAATDLNASWYDTIRLFEDICQRLFREKDQEALVYRVREMDGGERLRWMSPDDLDFLIGVGLRALIEKCWERRILLVGIAKDSASRFLTRHYLGVMRYLDVYPRVDVGPLPWTDRVFLETVADRVEELAAPWSTVDFDGSFMSLHLDLDSEQQRRVSGMRGRIVAPPERLFARSLA